MHSTARAPPAQRRPRAQHGALASHNYTQLAPPQVQHNCNVLLVAIHAVAFFTDLALVRRSTPLVRAAGALGAAAPAGGLLFFPLRYVQWLHSTPTMLLLMALMSDLSRGRLWLALGADVVMIVTGCAASWLSGPLQSEWYYLLWPVELALQL